METSNPLPSPVLGSGRHLASGSIRGPTLFHAGAMHGASLQACSVCLSLLAPGFFFECHGMRHRRQPPHHRTRYPGSGGNRTLVSVVLGSAEDAGVGRSLPPPPRKQMGLRSIFCDFSDSPASWRPIQWQHVLLLASFPSLSHSSTPHLLPGITRGHPSTNTYMFASASVF